MLHKPPLIDKPLLLDGALCVLQPFTCSPPLPITSQLPNGYAVSGVYSLVRIPQLRSTLVVVIFTIARI